jgi:hypothetical protein
MGQSANENAARGVSEAQHKDASRTITESGAAAAAGLKANQPNIAAQVNQSPTARKVNAGSSDR